MKVFKLDVLELGRCINGTTDTYGREVSAQDAATELARQLRDHGAPDAPFEQQAREMLAAFTALQQAGEEMPSVDDAVQFFAGWYPQERPGRQAVAHFLGCLRPLFARLTQERDTFERYFQREAQAHRESADRWVAKANALEAEVDALRQRAERAKRELAVERSAHGGARADASHLKTQLDAALARIAELGASREPGADESRLRTQAHVALLDWLALATGTRDGHDSRIVDTMTSLKSRTSAEPGADVVERLGLVFTTAPGDVDDAIRAVLAHLAAMGEDAWPTCEEMIKAALTGERFVDTWPNVLALFRSRLSPVFGALRAKVAELEAERSKVGLILGNHGAKLQNRVTDALDIMSGRVPKCSVCGSRDACKLDCPRRR